MASPGLRVADFCRQDTGCQSSRLVQAINQFTPHQARGFRLARDYLACPADVEWRQRNQPAVREFLADAEVVHCHGMYSSARPWRGVSPRARWVIHQHGRPGRHWDDWIREDRRRGALRVVSTLNLLSFVEGDPSRWIPAPLDLEFYDELRRANYRGPTERDGAIRIAHSPTRRDYKGTDDIIAAVRALERRGYPVRLELIEGVSQHGSIRRKSSCDIVYDQMHLCYGNSGLEGMAFGQPTVVGMPDDVRATVRRVVGYEPFVFATPETLERELERLVSDEGIRLHWGAVGRRYVEGWHEHSRVARRVSEIYEGLS